MILRLLPVCSVLLMKSGARLRKLGVEPQGSRKCTKMCDFANPQSHSYLYNAWIQKKKALAFFLQGFFLLRFFFYFPFSADWDAFRSTTLPLPSLGSLTGLVRFFFGRGWLNLLEKLPDRWQVMA